MFPEKMTTVFICCGRKMQGYFFKNDCVTLLKYRVISRVSYHVNVIGYLHSKNNSENNKHNKNVQRNKHVIYIILFTLIFYFFLFLTSPGKTFLNFSETFH